MVSKDQEGKLACKPIKSKIVSLFAEQNDLQYAVPGGLIGKYAVPGGLIGKFGQVSSSPKIKKENWHVNLSSQK